MKSKAFFQVVINQIYSISNNTKEWALVQNAALAIEVLKLG